MRAINFRAWDKENDRMIYPSNNNVYFNLTDDGISIEDLALEPYDGVFPLLDTILMQSTGLIDRNGVEIFEGDVVKIIGDLLDDDMSVIRFTEGGFYLDYKNLDTEFELLYSIDLPIEIIGNIYEDKELLEVEG